MRSGASEIRIARQYDIINNLLAMMERTIRWKGYAVTNYGIATYAKPGDGIVINNIMYDLDENMFDLDYIGGRVENPPPKFPFSNKYKLGKFVDPNKDTIIFDTMNDLVDEYIKMAPRLPNDESGYKIFTTWFSKQGEVTFTWKDDVIYIYHIEIKSEYQGQGIFKNMVKKFVQSPIRGFGLLYIGNKRLKNYIYNLDLPGYKFIPDKTNGIYAWVKR